MITVTFTTPTKMPFSKVENRTRVYVALQKMCLSAAKSK